VTVVTPTLALRPRLQAGVCFVASFGTAKSLAVLGPLLLARFLTPADYGALELALSIGLLIAVVSSLGIPLAVPQLYLALARHRIEDLLAFQIFAVALLSGLALLLPWSLLPAGALGLGVSLAALFALQLALSAYCRVRQARLWSGWVDNLALVLLPALVLGCYLASGRLVLRDVASACAVVPALVGGAALLVFLRVRRPGFGAAYRDALWRGGPMMLNATLMFCTASGLRLAIGRYLPLEDVAIYAFGARLCLGLVLVHQIGVTGLFARIYTLSAASADRGFAVGLAALVGLGLVLLAGFAVLGDRVSWGAVDMMAVRGLLPILCAQTVLWIVTAWLELPIGREGLAGASVLLFGALLGGFVAAVVALDALGGLGLTSISVVFTGFLLLCVLGQIRLLARRGLRFTRLLRALPLVALLPLACVL
jgi:O-antigen/teichoic acid export membrane protein